MSVHGTRPRRVDPTPSAHTCSAPCRPRECAGFEAHLTVCAAVPRRRRRSAGGGRRAAHLRAAGRPAAGAQGPDHGHRGVGGGPARRGRRARRPPAGRAAQLRSAAGSASCADGRCGLRWPQACAARADAGRRRGRRAARRRFARRAHRHREGRSGAGARPRVRLQVRDGPGHPRGREDAAAAERPGLSGVAQAAGPRSASRPPVLWTVRRDGSAEAAVPGSLDGVEAVLVTDEPAGGSEVPSKPPGDHRAADVVRRPAVRAAAPEPAARRPPGPSRRLIAPQGGRQRRRFDGHVLPPPVARDRRLVLQLRQADLPGLHDGDARGDALPGLRGPPATRVHTMRSMHADPHRDLRADRDQRADVRGRRRRRLVDHRRGRPARPSSRTSRSTGRRWTIGHDYYRLITSGVPAFRAAAHRLQHVHPVLAGHDARAVARARALPRALLHLAGCRVVRRPAGVAQRRHGRRLRRGLRLDGRRVRHAAGARDRPDAVGHRPDHPADPGDLVHRPEHPDRPPAGSP